MTIKYGQDLYQCGRYQAAGWEARCTRKEVWGERVGVEEPAIVEVYTLNGSWGGPDDADGVWTDEANAVDGSILTYANTLEEGSETVKFLAAKGWSGQFIDTLAIKQVRFRFYGHIAGGLTFEMNALFYTATNRLKGSAQLRGDTVPAWSEWADVAGPSSGRIQYPWTPALLSTAEVRVHGLDGKANDIIDARLYAVELEITYERGWGQREASNETWTQVKP